MSKDVKEMYEKEEKQMMRMNKSYGLMVSLLIKVTMSKAQCLCYM